MQKASISLVDHDGKGHTAQLAARLAHPMRIQHAVVQLRDVTRAATENGTVVRPFLSGNARTAELFA